VAGLDPAIHAFDAAFALPPRRLPVSTGGGRAAALRRRRIDFLPAVSAEEPSLTLEA
jgi:hypothetical protein